MLHQQIKGRLDTLGITISAIDTLVEILLLRKLVQNGTAQLNDTTTNERNHELLMHLIQLPVELLLEISDHFLR